MYPNKPLAYATIAKYMNCELAPEIEAIIAKDPEASLAYALDVVKGVFELGEPAIAKPGRTACRYLNAVIASYAPAEYDAVLMRLHTHQPGLVYVEYYPEQFELINLELLLRLNINFAIVLSDGNAHVFCNKAFVYAWAYSDVKTWGPVLAQQPSPKTFLETIAELTAIGEAYPVLQTKLDHTLANRQNNQTGPELQLGSNLTL